MTITKNLRRRIRRYALMCVMAATTAGMVESSRPTMAGDHSGGTHDSLSCFEEELCGWVEELSSNQFGPDSPIVAESPKPSISEPFFSVRLDDQLAIDTCSYDDWLAQQFAEKDKAASPANDAVATAEYLGKQQPTSVAHRSSRTSAGFNATLAAITASATSGNPISFGYWSEPFAMVGPTANHAIEEIETFQAWFRQSAQVGGIEIVESSSPEDDSLLASTEPFVPVVDFDGTIDGEPSMPRPVRMPIESAVTIGDDAVIIQPSELLVGSSPIIATLEESYLAYDLTEQDLATLSSIESDDELSSEPSAPSVLWGAVFDRQNQPFCIRSLAVLREPGWSPLAKNVPTVSAESEPIAESSPDASALAEPALVGSATCLLDEWVWYVGNALEDHGVTGEWLQPETIGERIVLLVVSSETLAERAAIQLALVWPIEPKPAVAVPGDGARLLARAEAVPAADATLVDAEQLISERKAESVTEQQLARATATVVQWVDAAQSVIDDVSNHLDDVIEVARNRGTQDDSTRRE